MPVGRHVPAPRVYIISDHMPAARHMATGGMFDSKSAFRAATRAAGCVELGNDAPLTPPVPARNDVRNDVIQAMQMVEQGYQPPPLEQAAPDVRIYEAPKP